MASRPKRAKVAVEAPEAPITTFGPDSGGNRILRAWQGLYHLFGARVERFDVDSNGVTAVNFTVDENYGTPESIMNLIPQNDKIRLDFYPLFLWANGEAPAPFTSSLDLTSWMTKNMKVAGQKGRSPQIVKDAIRAYKEANGLAVPRGRPRKAIKINLENLDPDALAGVDFSELTRLQEVVNGAVASASEVTA